MRVKVKGFGGRMHKVPIENNSFTRSTPRLKRLEIHRRKTNTPCSVFTK